MLETVDICYLSQLHPSQSCVKASGGWEELQRIVLSWESNTAGLFNTWQSSCSNRGVTHSLLQPLSKVCYAPEIINTDLPSHQLSVWDSFRPSKQTAKVTFSQQNIADIKF